MPVPTIPIARVPIVVEPINVVIDINVAINDPVCLNVLAEG
jgi:hypothetical protein